MASGVELALDSGMEEEWWPAARKPELVERLQLVPLLELA
jgi:hypothetical protein